jgi:16S rRNA (cytosine1402-N4)-methyltransferase
MHIPVLINEVISYLALQPGAKIIDCNIGAGGHAKKIIAKLGLSGRLLGIDRDAAALKSARDHLAAELPQVKLVNDSFQNLSDIALANDFTEVNGIIFDLGLSSMQLDSPGRGFSWRRDELLDMRMDKSQGLTAAELIASSSADDLVQIFSDYGEVRFSKSLAAKIVQSRETNPITTTGALEKIVLAVAPPNRNRSRLHPATQVFQALRIAVNDELNQLRKTLPQALNLLRPGGRLLVISFHSLEDRIVKNFFREESKDCICEVALPVCRCEHTATLKILTKKPVTPSVAEVRANPRARSAKLRVAEKIK